MSRYSSAEEIQKEHVDTLGPDLGPVYHALYNECAWFHIKWHQDFKYRSELRIAFG